MRRTAPPLGLLCTLALASGPRAHNFPRSNNLLFAAYGSLYITNPPNTAFKPIQDNQAFGGCS